MSLHGRLVIGTRVGLLASAMLAATIGSASAVSPKQPVGGPPDWVSLPDVVSYAHDDALQNSKVETLQGTKLKGGGCAFKFPGLELGPDESAIESRQLSTNFKECSTVIETGVPTDGQEDSYPLDGTGETETPLVPNPKPQQKRAAAGASGFYRVWWEDVINLKVTEVKSEIAWTFNGTCVTSASGSAYYWWRSGTGWLKDGSNSWISDGCASRAVNTDAVYKNGAFCWPGTVWNYYSDVVVRGRNDGSIGSSLNDTWTTYPFACPTLHYHSELKKTG